MGIDPGGGWRSVASSVRNLPLAGVAVSLGYRRDGLDRSRWKRPGSVLSINGAKFFDHLAGSGGGGAIDLVMHARCCGFRDAVWYLAGRGFAAPVVEDGSGGRAEGDCREAFRLPERADFFWPRVRDWLASERGLDGCLLDRCWRRGLAYADAWMHAVFVCRDGSGAAVGAELVGLSRRRDGGFFKGMARGSRKALGGLWVSDGSAPDAVFLAESAVDALSALSLPADAVKQRPVVMASTGGIVSTVPRWLEGWNARRIFCGYDADRAGDKAAVALRRRDRRIVRMRPAAGKDWNELLLRTWAGERV